jgi:hypothetical protein
LLLQLRLLLLSMPLLLLLLLWWLCSGLGQHDQLPHKAVARPPRRLLDRGV